jgi:hypothetical protein
VPLILAAPVRVTVPVPPTVGLLLVGADGQQTTTVTMLGAPAAGATPVSVTSSDPTVASVVGTPVIAAGSQTVTLTIATGREGVATLLLQVGSEVRQLTVIVGPPPPGRVPLILAAPVGVAVLVAPSAGVAVADAGVDQEVRVLLLDSPRASDTLIAVTTTDPSVAAPLGPAIVPAGSAEASLTIRTGSEGVAVLSLQAVTGEARELTVIVGQPPPGSVPLIIAPPVGVEVP